MLDNIYVENLNTITGFIKLKKDPKIEKFDINNIVLKDSIIKNNEWVIGIALLLANESLISRNIQIRQKKVDHLTILINRFVLMCLCQILLLILVFFLNFNKYIKFHKK